MYILCSPVYDANFIPETISDDTLGGKQNCVIQNLFLFQLFMYSKTLVNMYYISNKALNHTFECFEIA